MNAIATFRSLAADTLDAAVTSVWDTVDLSGFVGALTLFAASESTDRGAWGKLAKQVSECVEDGLDREGVKARIDMAEEDYKRINGVTALPKAWTSAKAVALKAVEQGVPLMGEDGEALGKSAVERANKGMDGGKSAFEKATESANRVVKLFGDLTPTEQEAIRTILRSGGI
jgi:hypothetical protein